ncbi:putative Rio2 N terminal RIO1 family Phosphotransferase enzyme family [Trypanosoma vivax]|uniref:Serine/threonine-protein kinase RIO2 n=1 Tax=Trypanosoma vivax (strain Y486) TaxID=1055687 RepID=G0TWV3_TRYVY|nr:hypothetical protein TRVL_00233 [Trypanosoma vivax]KAH8613573.1 putative Rio2 N terminal RIO1 family Phosphotransferase enzyme family [Trypanosoma vivax]CCC48441.1 putative conserved RIO1-domain protein [Trypanosoma vivax Y486]
MVKFDVSLLRFLEPEDFRVLTAIEMAMRNHEVAPTALIERIAQLPHGGCRKRLQNLLKNKIIHHENTMYDGFTMKYASYDYLALNTLCKRGTVTSAGHIIGCGKESDIILVRNDAGYECVLKLHRLGRCSFRTVSRNRDYKDGRRRHGESWFYLSRLAAQKEFAFMRTLYDEGFPVPKPIDQNRHAVLMELVPGTTLNNITELGDAMLVYRRCLDLMVKLAESGLIHGDFNEFNLMVTEDMRVVVIDFPQMISINHPNAAELFDRDVVNLANFFHRRFKLKEMLYPTLEGNVTRRGELDRVVFASGYFSKKQQQDLERLLEHHLSQENGDALDTELSDEERKETVAAAVVQTKPNAGAIGNDTQRHNSTLLDESDKATAAVQSEDSEYEEEMTESDTRSIDQVINDAAVQRRQNSCNPNYNPDGTLDESHMRSQVRRTIRQKDNRQFDKALHRNVQKGRHKQRIRRQIKQGADKGFFD